MVSEHARHNSDTATPQHQSPSDPPTLLVFSSHPRAAQSESQSPTACPSLPLVSANSLRDDQPTNYAQPRGSSPRPLRGSASVWTRRYFSILPRPKSPLHEGETRYVVPPAVAAPQNAYSLLQMKAFCALKMKSDGQMDITSRSQTAIFNIWAQWNI
jgi:hypothetical protein